jgi:glycolate oxidase subunit GlcD
VLPDLAALVGADHVEADPPPSALADASAYAGVSGRAAALVRPGTPQEVAAVVRACAATGTPVVPRGGGTGFSGGCVPQDRAAVVVALDRLAAVRSLDALQWRAHVEAGVTTATVARLAREHGLRFPVDPGAAEQSQVGGNIATNAGGPHCFKHGVMRAWVTGVEVVLPDGALVTLGGPTRKDAAGYDLVGLMCGSEGTLGIITAAWLRLLPAPPLEVPLVAAYPDARTGQEALDAVLGSGVVPAVLEFLDAGAVRAAAPAFPRGALRTDAGFVLIAEVDTTADDVEEVARALALEGRAEVLRPAARELWRWRDGVSIAVAAIHGGKLSEDVAVPVERLAEAVEGTLAIAARHGLEGCSWGHAGDGNLHSTFLLDPADATQRERADAAARDLFEMAIELGGTVSGEHGLGLLKAGWLSRQWEPAAVDAHEAVRAALDPAGIMNPAAKRP